MSKNSKNQNSAGNLVNPVPNRKRITRLDFKRKVYDAEGKIDGNDYEYWMDKDSDSDTTNWQKQQKGQKATVDTDTEDLDSEHVYALITVPGRISPTMDSRYMDAISYSKNAEVIKHSMTQDTVKGNLVEMGFDKPPVKILKDDAKIDVVCGAVPRILHTLSYAQKQQALAVEHAGKGSIHPNHVSVSQPSPVYPDIVAIPLMSMERCYGPWRSSTTEYVPRGRGSTRKKRNKVQDLGGKVEFIKNENIAPWNYAGYTLMNEAGQLEAEFSNSLLLFGERGGFSYADAPFGLTLGAELEGRGPGKGPLVTSINVNISEGGINTSVSLDLYSARFGKLQKQKELAISSITRERQKIIDSNNRAYRYGIGKADTDKNLLKPLQTDDVRNLMIAAAESKKAQLDHIEFVAKETNTVTADGTVVKEETVSASNQASEDIKPQSKEWRDKKTSINLTDVVTATDTHVAGGGFVNFLDAPDGVVNDLLNQDGIA